jgi:hypothetical protein
MYDHLEACTRCATFDTVVRRGLLVARNLPAIEPSPDFNVRLQNRLRLAAGGLGIEGPIERRTMGRRVLKGLRVAAAVGVIAAGLAAMHSLPRPYAPSATTTLQAGTGSTSGPAAKARPSSIAPGLIAAITLGLPTWPPVSSRGSGAGRTGSPAAFQTASLSP